MILSKKPARSPRQQLALMLALVGSVCVVPHGLAQQAATGTVVMQSPSIKPAGAALPEASRQRLADQNAPLVPMSQDPTAVALKPHAAARSDRGEITPLATPAARRHLAAQSAVNKGASRVTKRRHASDAKPHPQSPAKRGKAAHKPAGKQPRGSQLGRAEQGPKARLHPARHPTKAKAAKAKMTATKRANTRGAVPRAHQAKAHAA